MAQTVACLSSDDYCTVREVIECFNLWWDEGEPPSRMLPVLRMRGWDIAHTRDIVPLIAIAVRHGRQKRLAIREDAPLSVQAACIAHTLAHDILKHPHAVDLIQVPSSSARIPNRDVHPAHDAAANAAAALLLIPERFVRGDFSVSQIASWCGVPTHVVTRRLTGTMVLVEEPGCVIHIDRKRPTPLRNTEPRRSGTEDLILS